MSDIDRRVSEAMARVLLMRSPFFASLVMQCRREGVHGLGALMATNGRVILYDPLIVERVDLLELEFAVVHEGCHIGLRHVLRRGDRDARLWNFACDYVVNAVVVDSFPDFGDIAGKYLYDPDRFGVKMSAEQVYELLKNDVGVGDENRLGAGLGQMSVPGSGVVGGGVRDVVGKNFMDGVDLYDAPVDFGNAEDLGRVKAEFDILINRAMSSAKRAGSLPAGMESYVEAKEPPVVDWRDLLRDWLDRGLGMGDYDWMVPDRRLLGSLNGSGGDWVYFPGMVDGENELRVLLVADTSGSVSMDEKKRYASEISGILEEFSVRLQLMYCDARVQDVVDVSREDFPLRLNFKGGGGTRFCPVFNYIQEHVLEPRLVLFFTDMGAFDWDDVGKLGVPPYDVLWMATGSYSGRDIPFGDVIDLREESD